MPLFAVLLLGSGFIRHPPAFVRAVPVDSRGQTFLKIGVLWFPTEFGLKFGSVGSLARMPTR